MSGESSAVPPTPQDSPGLVEALKKRFAAEVAERELRHRAEMKALRESADAHVAGQDQRYRAELQALQQSHAAAVEARDEQHAAHLRAFQQSLDEVGGQLRAAAAAHQQEAQARTAAQAELATRTSQLDMQYRALEGQQAEIARLTAQAADLAQALAAERETSAGLHDRALRLEAQLRLVVAQSHRAALDAAGQVLEMRDDAVKRGDHLADEVELHEAAVNQLRSTIADQRADREQLMHERQEARDRCIALESQLHSLTLDARHLAEGLRRVEAERDAERRRWEQPAVEVTEPPRLRIAGIGDSA